MADARPLTDKEYKKKVDEERKKRKPQQEDPKLWGSIIIPLPKCVTLHH